MKKICCLLLAIAPAIAFSQKLGIGIKAGLSFSNITNASAINASSQSGFHAGVFLGLGHKLIGSRTELLYSRQGYNYSSDSTTGSVKNDYIVLAQLLAINITKFVQVQLGMQMGYLLNARADSSTKTGNASIDNILGYYNRFDYGFAGGLEIHPIAGLLIGARYNISFSNLYKQYSSGSSSNGSPSFASTSGINFKNNLVQLFLGYRF
jgi:hypothetical protein